MRINHRESHPEQSRTGFVSSPCRLTMGESSGVSNNGDTSRLGATAKREDHGHSLTLYYSLTQEQSLICNVCHESIARGCWCYYCTDCDCGTHLDSVEAEAVGASENNGGGETEDIELMVMKFRHRMRMQSMLAGMVSSSINGARLR